MDKAQEKIAIYLATGDGYNLNKPDEDLGGYYLMARDILEILGYHKLPKDRPPLLSNKEIEELAVVPPYIFQDLKWIAQAQREADIKHYEALLSR